MSNIEPIGADGYSLSGALLFAGLKIIDSLSANQVTAGLAWAVGITTLLYNVIRIVKELKSK